jgi:hypothetical protein
VGSWKPKVEQTVGDLFSTVDFLKESVEQIDRQVTTAVARPGQGAVDLKTTAAIARSGHGVVNLVQQQPPLLLEPAALLNGCSGKFLGADGHR